ncbi:nucleolar complex protein 4 homolog A [Bradysia coprophila]|uniref:nucleolar complex protein 4 homolog A n=1 Tax=Bradysia coprophila TaxID=38358 RepID=UPI00187DD53A|nr:nucleolar complex protein 4 homolog A [Bradysia coprophila]
MHLKQLKSKASEFINNRKSTNELLDIIEHFNECIVRKSSVTPCLLTLEQIFMEIISRRDMYIDIQPLKSAMDSNQDLQYKEWLQERYRDVMKSILQCFNSDKPSESSQALVTAMHLLSHEGKHPIEHTTDANFFPINRFRNILLRLLSSEKLNHQLIMRFKEYSAYADVLFYAWKLLPGLTPKGKPASDVYVQNYLDLLGSIPLAADVNEPPQYLCGTGDHPGYDYAVMRRNLNKVWNCAVLWDLTETTHKQLLIVLLEKILPHLDKPVLLTDFLMDSLDVGGPISLLALQGVFTLIQQHNLSYPNIYEKLYSMFEPEIFHTKFKARLFYLADIFLSSIALPENLVAAFIKRLARLALVAPPQDIVIILYFIGNLIIRHPGLKRLICHASGGEVSKDPYIMDERVPNKSFALESSLWEIATLQSHALPSIAQAAKFITNPLPSIEWDLSSVLEVNENDIFDQEIVKRSKACALNFERPQSMFQAKSDRFTQYWQLF